MIALICFDILLWLIIDHVGPNDLAHNRHDQDITFMILMILILSM